MVSIILCTYNRAALLPRAIRSVLRQTYTDFELIVIDDGSTDDTARIVDKFFDADKRIRYFYQQNKGLAGARNAGLKKTRGDIITFIDSDDEYDPTHIDRRIKYLSKHPSVDMVFGGMKLLGPRSKHYVRDVNNPSTVIHLSRCHPGGTFFFKKRVLVKVHAFGSIPFGEDVDFFLRVKKYYSVRKVVFQTYLYHLDGENRLCDSFTAGRRAG